LITIPDVAQIRHVLPPDPPTARLVLMEKP